LEANVSTDAPIAAAEMARSINSAYQLVYENEGGGLTKVASATAWTSAQTATGQVVGILTDIKEIASLFASTVSGSVGFSAGDREIHPVEKQQIEYKRAHGGGHGTYLTPQEYSISRLSTSTPASVGLLQLDYWPSVTGFYFPIHYIRQFVPIDSATVTTPDCSDIGSRDIVWLAAIDLAPRIGRQRFIPTLQSMLSKGMTAMLARKKRALETGDQNA
jgi:hypothetical protein